MDRIQELVDVVLADFADMNIGPEGTVPTKTIYLRVCKNGLMWSDVHPALVWAVEEGGLLTFTPGGIADMGILALTQAGYERSRG
ncbi:hypothetical protein ACQ4WP_29165 [Janthinobacterium sp. GB4P2]|uniref:hypothetical protein n=1 Tax=Janthinobacterium sp. GB4P2 TaxID=3424189 RepID=UPI003F1FE106